MVRNFRFNKKLVEQGEYEINPKTGKRFRYLREIVADFVVQRLKKFDGNRTKTARSLGISVRTLRYWIKAYGLIDDSDAVDSMPRIEGNRAVITASH